MLYISLILSAVLLLISNHAARRGRHAAGVIMGWSAIFLVVPFFMMCLLPAVGIQALLLGVVAMIWHASGRGPSSFLKLSCGATLVAYGIAGIFVFQSEREYARLRARFPYESLEGRISPHPPEPAKNPLNPPVAERLSGFETELSGYPRGVRGFRDHHLESLHEHAVTLFINSPGFGVMRMSLPADYNLAMGLRKGPVPDQPGSRFASIWSTGELQPLFVADDSPFRLLLEDSLLDFVNPAGFGYFKDLRHVAGFQSHRFSKVPEPANLWRVQNLELVSLLQHDPPEIYVSSHLPAMDQLHGVPTRPLDPFEEMGLDAIRRGEDLFTSRAREGGRMLGAIRSVHQCLACHGGERGALLGAFSYTLRSDGP